MLVTVKSGSNEVVTQVNEGSTVADLRGATNKHLSLEPDFQAWLKVDGERPVLIAPDMEATTLVTNQSTVEFVKPAGQKG